MRSSNGAVVELDGESMSGGGAVRSSNGPAVELDGEAKELDGETMSVGGESMSGCGEAMSCGGVGMPGMGVAPAVFLGLDMLTTIFANHLRSEQTKAIVHEAVVSLAHTHAHTNLVIAAGH